LTYFMAIVKNRMTMLTLYLSIHLRDGSRFILGLAKEAKYGILESELLNLKPSPFFYA